MRNAKPKGEDLNKLYREAEAELCKIPGVVSVGFGYKERGGKITDELSIRVYVEKKKAEDKLSKEEKIPADFKGVQTDVLTIFDSIPASCEDISHHDPIIGGTTITTDGILFQSGGTLGCLVTLNGEKGRDNIGILSNKHVLDASKDKPVYHPFFTNASTINEVKSKSEGVIAKMYNVGTQSNVNYRYPGDASPTQHPYYVDAATAKVTTSHCSCCPTNCGTKYKAEINGIGGIKGVKRLQPSDLTGASPYLVKKVGRRTGETVGRVVDVNVTYPASAPRKHNAILIAPTANNCEGNRKFADEGDSGSVLLNANDEVVGLLYSIPNVPAGNAFFGHGIASHIHPVLHFLKCTIITTPSSDSDNRRIPEQTEEAHHEKLAQLKYDFVSQSAEHEKMYAILETNRAEAVRLVNENRPVTVTWHRHQGPAFVAHFIKNFRDPEHQVPLEIKGNSLPQLLEAMRGILSEHGSSDFKEAINQYGDLIIASSANSRSVQEWLTRIAKVEHQAHI